MVAMAEKNEGQRDLCDVWTLEMHFPRILKHFSPKHGSNLNTRVHYRELSVNKTQG